MLTSWSSMVNDIRYRNVEEVDSFGRFLKHTFKLKTQVETASKFL